MSRLPIVVLLIAAACSTGPTAPEIQAGADRIACADTFCVTYPPGWVVEDEGDDFISLSNPAAPDQAFATVAPVSMQALVESAGGSWPAPTEEAVRSFWQLLDEADVATFERMERMTGGSFRSEGSYEDGRLWHLLVPGSGTRGIAAEVRGPNSTWAAHADVILDGIEVFG